MKNILIIETDSDNAGCQFGLIEDLEVPDENFRKAITAALKNKQFENTKIVNEQYKKLNASEGTIYSSGGEYRVNEIKTVGKIRRERPFTVEHIIS